MTKRSLPSGQIVYDPRGSVTVEPLLLAPRKSSLDGSRLGVLDNSKWNASKLLRHIITQLEVTTSLTDVQYYKKNSFSRPADSKLLDTIAGDVDVVITAIGD